MYIKSKIINRPNRFIAYVDLNEEEVKCHVPATGSIGGYKLDGLPCLLSGPHEGANRKTKYTVEAIQFPMNDGTTQWIGINQTAVNGIVANLLTTNKLDKLNVKGDIKREVKLGKSRMDFKVGNTYIEVKMPLKEISVDISLPSTNKTEVSADRMVKQLNDVMSAMDSGDKGIMLIVFMYDAPKFSPKATDTAVSKRISSVVNESSNKGMDYWQLNLSINEKGVNFESLTPLDM